MDTRDGPRRRLVNPACDPVTEVGRKCEKSFCYIVAEPRPVPRIPSARPGDHGRGRSSLESMGEVNTTLALMGVIGLTLTGPELKRGLVGYGMYGLQRDEE